MPLNNDDLFLVNQGGESKKITYSNLKTNINDGVSGGGVTKIIAGDNITISPTGGTGEVTITGQAGGDEGDNIVNYNGAAAWGVFDGTGTPAKLGGGLNFATVTRATGFGIGVYDITFNTPMPDENYSVVCSGEKDGNVSIPTSYSNKSVRGFTIYTLTQTGANYADADNCSFAVHALNALPPRGTTGLDAWGLVDVGTTDPGGNLAADNISSQTNYNCTVSKTEKPDGTTAAAAASIFYVTFNTPMPTDDYAVTFGITNTWNVTPAIKSRSAEGFEVQTYSTGGGSTAGFNFQFQVACTNANLPATITQEQLDAIFDGLGYQGITAWANVEADGTVASGMNIKSPIASDGSGTYTVEFITPMPNANYAVVDGGYQISNWIDISNQTETGFTYTSSGSAVINSPFNIVVVSQNAAPPRGTTGADAWGFIAPNNNISAGYNIKQVTGPTNAGAGITNAYTVEFINPMPDSNYSIIASIDNDLGGQAFVTPIDGSRSPTQFQVRLWNSSSTAITGNWNVVVHASNANLPTTITQEQVEALARNPMVGAWASVNSDASDFTGFNIASVGRSGSKYVVTFANPMSNTDYAVIGSASISSNNFFFEVNSANKTVNGFEYWMVGPDTAGGTGNSAAYFQVIGATRNAAPLGGGADSWGNVNADGTYEGSFNVKSITYTTPSGVNTYAVEFDSAMPNANYSIVLGAGRNPVNGSGSVVVLGTKNANGFTVTTGQVGSGANQASTFDFAVFATDGNAGGHWANDDGTLVPAKASDVTITGTLTCDDVVETGTLFSLKNIGNRLAALEAGAVSDDATDSALLTLIASLTQRVTELEQGGN